MTAINELFDTFRMGAGGGGGAGGSFIDDPMLTDGVIVITGDLLFYSTNIVRVKRALVTRAWVSLALRFHTSTALRLKEGLWSAL